MHHQLVPLGGQLTGVYTMADKAVEERLWDREILK